jgi:hypothetical protein
MDIPANKTQNPCDSVLFIGNTSNCFISFIPGAPCAAELPCSESNRPQSVRKQMRHELTKFLCISRKLSHNQNHATNSFTEHEIPRRRRRVQLLHADVQIHGGC